MSGGQSTLTCLPRHLDVHHCLSVNVSTLKRYRSALSEFVAFLVQRRANPTSGAELDLLVLDFKQEQSLTLSKLELLVASLEFHLPVLKGQLVYTKRASKGLCRTRSIQHTVPLLSEPAKLLALHLAALGKHRIALGLVVQCLTGLRPSELLGLREQHVFRSTSSCPRFIFRLGVGTGTKVQREQTTYLEWERDLQVSKLLWRLVHCTESNALLFPVSYSQYRELLAQVGEHLGAGVRFTPHSPRAGFATEESSRGVDISNIRERGRWASEQSFKTYLDIVSASQVEAAFHLRGIGTALGEAIRHFSEFFGPGVFGGKVYGIPPSGGDRRRGYPSSAPIGAEGGRKTRETKESKAFNTASSLEAKGHATSKVGWFIHASRSIRQFFAY